MILGQQLFDQGLDSAALERSDGSQRVALVTLDLVLADRKGFSRLAMNTSLITEVDHPALRKERLPQSLAFEPESERSGLLDGVKQRGQERELHAGGARATGFVDSVLIAVSDDDDHLGAARQQPQQLVGAQSLRDMAWIAIIDDVVSASEQPARKLVNQQAQIFVVRGVEGPSVGDE